MLPFLVLLVRTLPCRYTVVMVYTAITDAAFYPAEWMLRFFFPAAGGRCRLFIGVGADFIYCS